MDFRITALPADLFAPWFAMTDDELERHGGRRVVADAPDAFPCRVSLRDASIGDALLLVPFEHLAARSAYRGAGAIYVGQGARTGAPAPGEVPEQIRRRLLSVRAYDADGWMLDAEVCPGHDVRHEIRRLFADDRVAYLHLHNARRGCYACRVDRV